MSKFSNWNPLSVAESRVNSFVGNVFSLSQEVQINNANQELRLGKST